MTDTLSLENKDFGQYKANIFGEWYVDEKRMAWKYLVVFHLLKNGNTYEATLSTSQKINKDTFFDLVDYLEFELGEKITFSNQHETMNDFLSIINENLLKTKPHSSASEAYYGI